jgi:hypothetical protein
MNMKRLIIGFVMVAAIVLAISAQAGQPSKHAATVVTGEVVDTGCYLGHSSNGASHAECATMCINQGMPMGVLTQKGELYLVTMNHDNPDAFNKLKKMAGKNVAVTGHVFTRAGMTAIEIDTFKPAA